MIFDFVTNSYTTIFVIFAAIFGMSYPLLLSSIQHIDEKYSSSLLARKFRQEPLYLCYQIFLVLFIIATVISPFVLSRITSPNLLYIVICILFALIGILMANTVFLYKQINTYYDPKKLVKLLDNEKDSKGALAQFDVACYASRVRDIDIYKKSMHSVYKQFQNEKAIVGNDKPVVYSVNLTSILSRIAVAIGNESRDDYLHNLNDIIDFLYDYKSKTLISEETYGVTWEMVNWAVYGNNYNWFIQYWNSAEKYYTSFFTSNMLPETYASSIEFCKRHIMVGALLVFSKKNSWLEHIMKYSQTYLLSHKLIPGTMVQINQFVRFLSNNHKVHTFLKNYQFMGLNQGTKTEDTIINYIYSYLGLIFIRIWSDQYNVDGHDSLELPNSDEKSIDTNDNMIKGWKNIREKVNDWYMGPVLKEFNLDKLPEKDVVLSKIEEFINVLNLKNIKISSSGEIDSNKVKEIADQLIFANYYLGIVIPNHSMSNILDKDEIKSEKIDIDTKINACVVLKNSTNKAGGLKGLISNLNSDIKQKYLEFLFENINYERKEVPAKDVFKLIDEQKIGSTYIIVSSKNLFGNYIQKNKDGILFYKGIQIFELGLNKDNINEEFFILKKNELPYGEVIKSEKQDTNMEPIDDINFLYGNIYNLEQSYRIHIQQTINIHYIQGANGTLVSII